MMLPPWELRTISSCSFFRESVFSGAGVASCALSLMGRGAGAALMVGGVPMGASEGAFISVEGGGVGVA